MLVFKISLIAKLAKINWFEGKFAQENIHSCNWGRAEGLGCKVPGEMAPIGKSRNINFVIL